MNKIRITYLLIITFTGILIYICIDGKHLLSKKLIEHPKAEIIDFTSPETKEQIRQQAIEDSIFAIKSMKYLYNLQQKTYDTHIGGYNIIKTHEIVDSIFNVYSLVITKNDSIVFRTKIGVEDSNRVSYILYPLIPNGRRQIIIEEHTGGAHCCSMYWILDPTDTIITLYYSNETESEIGSLDQIDDFDGDGNYEFTQLLNSFHYFDGLCGAASPAGLAIFKYSKDKKSFILANKDFPSVILEDTEKRKSEVRKLLDTTKSFNKERSEYLLSIVLGVLIDYVYAGQDSIGWAYFDKNYILSDKKERKRKIQEVFNESVVYKQLYPNLERRRITSKITTLEMAR